MRRHGAGLRKIPRLATLAIVVTNILPLCSCAVLPCAVLHFISSKDITMYFHCSVPSMYCAICEVLTSRKIAHSGRPDARRRQSLAIHHLTSYQPYSLLACQKIFDCIQFRDYCPAGNLSKRRAHMYEPIPFPCAISNLACSLKLQVEYQSFLL